MEELRKLAISNFETWDKFQENGTKSPGISTTRLPAPPLRVIRITTFSDGQDPSHFSGEVTESTLLHTLEHTPQLASSGPRDASLKLLVIPRYHDDEIQLSKKLFLDAFHQFNIDPLILQQIWLSGYGLHYYEHPHNDTFSFYIGTYVYSLFWSFNPATLETCAVLLLRATPRLRNGKHAIMTFEPVLKSYKAQIHTPFFLCFAVYVNFYRLFEEGLYLEMGNLRDIEVKTGHGPNSHNGGKLPASGILDLTKAAQEVADTQVHLSNLLRHGKYMTEIGLFLENSASIARWHSPIPRPLDQKAAADFEKLQVLLPMLKRQIKTAEPSVRYLQDRAIGQSSVITSLITHRDAQANIKLAESGRQMAESAKRDSSAMKSIAIMTMLFLPGTFFAALFAVPSMPKFGRDTFWLYWALALPSTLFVFGFWVWHHNVWSPWRKTKGGRPSQDSRSSTGISETKDSDSSCV